MGRERGRSGSVKLKGLDGRSSYMERDHVLLRVFTSHHTTPSLADYDLFVF